MNWASLGDFSSPIVQGRGVANRSFLTALGRFGSMIKRRVLFSPYTCGDESLNKLGYECRVRESIRTWDFSEGNWVLFHPDLDWGEAARVRSHFDWPVPLSALTHSLSYPHLIRNFLSSLPFLRDRDVLVCTSPTAKRVIEAILKKVGVHLNVRVIPLGLPDIPEPLPERLRQVARKELKIGGDDIVFLYFSRISEFSKADLFVLMRAIYHLSKEGRKNFRVIIAGGTEESDYYQYLKGISKVWDIEPWISVIPNPDEKDKQVLFSISDVFLGISDNFQETFGLVLLEAMYYRLPIIAFDWGGYRDVLADYPCKRLIKTYTLQGIEKEIVDLEILSYEPKLHLIWASTIFVDFEDLLMAMREYLYKRPQRGSIGLHPRFCWENIIPSWEDLWQWQLQGQAHNLNVRMKDKDVVLSDIFYAIYPSTRIGFDVGYRVRGDGLIDKGLGVHPWLKAIIDESKLKRFLSEGKGGTISEAKEWGLSELEVLWLIKQGWLAIEWS